MKHDTIVELLHWRALNQPAQDAYTFLVDGEKEGPRLTYAELEHEARKVGGLLQNYLRAGERVLLLYPSGLDFVAAFYGSLYAGIIPIPAPQPRPNKTLNRLQTIAADAGASVVLTTSSILTLTEKLFALAPELQNMRWLATDNLDDSFAGEFHAPQLKSDGLALLQYTSGSTSLPKGVMITHENIMQNSSELHLTLCHTEDTIFITWLPHFHDMGLIYGIIQPLYTGFPAYIMPSVYFLQRPVRWLEAITRYKGTHSAAPNFAYDLCVRKVTPEQRTHLDLSSWRMAANAAEPVSAQVIEQFTQTFGPCGFRRKTFSPCYGLAEVTLIATGVHRDEETPFIEVQATALGQNKVVEASESNHNSRTLVSCGRTAHTAGIAIVDPTSLTRCQNDQVGEIWVQGRSVAQGYWGRPDETEKVLQAHLADSGQGPFLRTGDLGVIKDGELYVVGRLKDIIIVAGNNHYPQDIEETVSQSHPSIRPHCCAAFSIEDNEQELLVIVAEVEPHYRLASHNSLSAPGALRKRPIFDSPEVIKAIRRAVAEEHELPVHTVEFIKAGSLPKTTSGKIQRRECKNLFLSHSLEKWEV
ncbi:MAG: fatty acyl-AMP ligase [Blastocatellia bacterium]